MEVDVESSASVLEPNRDERGDLGDDNGPADKVGGEGNPEAEKGA
jgi:hypothetical protein